MKPRSGRLIARFTAVLLAAAFCLLLASTLLAEERRLTTENYLIPSADPGIQLFIRNKHLCPTAPGRAARPSTGRYVTSP